MISSAKTTAVSFLAATALGAAVFMGCTVTSGTSNDTDGGTQNNKTKDSGPGDGDADTDAGTPEAGSATCETPQTSFFQPEACQACLAKSCCLELKNCFNLPGDDGAGKVNCDGFKDCLDDCAKKPEAEQEACNTECTDTLAAPGVEDAYKSIFACAEQSCAADCIE